MLQSNVLHTHWVTWRRGPLRVTHLPSKALPQPPLFAFHLLTAAAPTFRIAIFVTVPTDVEKPIIWASRSGNRVLARVGHRQGPLPESSPIRGVGGNEFQLGGSRRSPMAYFSALPPGARAKTTLPISWGSFMAPGAQSLAMLHGRRARIHSGLLRSCLLPENLNC